MSYVDEAIERVVKENPNEPEFHQAVKEVLDSLRPVVETHEQAFRRDALLERLVNPERQIKFLGFEQIFKNLLTGLPIGGGKGIMVDLYHNVDEAAKKYGFEGNFVVGANIAGFEKVVDAMNAQGIV